MAIILGSGTFQMKIGALASQSSPWTLMGTAASLVDGVVADGDGKYIEMTKTAEHECPPGTVVHTWIPPGVHSIEFLLDNSEVTVDADPPIDFLLLPAGWFPVGITTFWKVHRGDNGSGAGSGLVSFKVFRDGTEIYSNAAIPVSASAYQSGFDAPEDLLSVMNGPIRIEWELAADVTTDFGCGSFTYVNVSTYITHLYAAGAYQILAFWWTIPALSACGDIQESHHQLIEGDTDPGAPWVRLDPLNDNAAPVPTVDRVTPNHGPIAGGTALTIDGSGFGDACVLTIDGVPVTRVVVSQFKITCVAPAHAAGAVTVTVTNEDGVVSV